MLKDHRLQKRCQEEAWAGGSGISYNINVLITEAHCRRFATDETRLAAILRCVKPTRYESLAFSSSIRRFSLSNERNHIYEQFHILN